MKTLLLIVCFLMLAATSAIGDSYPGCNVSARKNVPFSSAAATDMFTVSVSGSPCYEASLVVSIVSDDGDRLYYYEAPFNPHVAVQWDDPGLAEDAERVVLRFVDHSSFSWTNDLPVWSPEDEYYEANYQVLQIDRTYYDKLRENDWLVYTHPIHYESWKVITYDRQKEQAVVVSEGGL